MPFSFKTLSPKLAIKKSKLTGCADGAAGAVLAGGTTGAGSAGIGNAGVAGVGAGALCITGLGLGTKGEYAGVDLGTPGLGFFDFLAIVKALDHSVYDLLLGIYGCTPSAAPPLQIS